MVYNFVLKKRLLVYWVAIFLTVTSAAGAQSSISTLEHARIALQHGEYATAIALAEELRMDYPLDAALIQARAGFETGAWDLALKAAETAVSIDASSYDARIFLGAILERSGRKTLAQLHFRRAFDLAETPSQRLVAADAVRRTQSSRSFRLSGQFGLAPSTNINRAAPDGQVNLLIGTGTITSEPPRADTGISYALTARAQQLPGIEVALSGLWLEDRSLRQNSVAVQFENHENAEQTSAFSILGHWRGGDHFMTRATFELTKDLGQANQLVLSAGATEYEDEGRQSDLSIQFERDVFKTSTRNLTVMAQAARVNSESAALASSSGTLGATLTLKGGGASLTMSPQFRVALWDAAVNPLPDARSDQQFKLSFSLKPQNVSYYGFRPVLGGALIHRDSNIALYNLQSEDLFLGLEASF